MTDFPQCPVCTGINYCACPPTVDPLEIAQRIYAAGPIRDRDTDRPLAWNELGDNLKLVLTIQAQQYIDAIQPGVDDLMEKLEAARTSAVFWAQMTAWQVPSFMRDGSDIADRVERRGYAVVDPEVKR